MTQIDQTTGEIIVARTQIMPLDVTQTRAAMTIHQDQLREIVGATDWQEFRDRKTGDARRFLKRSGWRKIAFWYALDLEIVREQVDRDEHGQIIRAHVIARARHPNGRYADGDGGCSITERGFSKPEHDIPAVATTRATNRAISNLVGAGDLSAEELDGGDPTAEPAELPWGPTTDKDKDLLQVADDIRSIAAPTPFEAERFVAVIGAHFNGLPVAAAKTLHTLAVKLADARAAGQTIHYDPPSARTNPSDPYPPSPTGGNRYQGD